jgi:hypothetical protein
MARFRRSLPLLALIRDVDDSDESLEEALDGLIDPDDESKGIVPADWRFKRQIGSTVLDYNLWFADIAAPESISHLRSHLAPLAVELGLSDFDASTILSPSPRAVTQACARHIYEYANDAGEPMFAGIRYPSRHNIRWTCWAIFGDRIHHSPQLPETSIDPADPDMMAAARELGLRVEGVRGHKQFY